MALTAKEISAILPERLRLVLKEFLPETNRSGELDRLADQSGVSGKWLESYLYGAPESIPQADYVLAVIAALVEKHGPAVLQRLIDGIIPAYVGLERPNPSKPAPAFSSRLEKSRTAST